MLLAGDIYVLLGLLAYPSEEEWTQGKLATYLQLSAATVSRSLQRLQEAALWRREDRSVQRVGAEGLLLHGVRYFIPARLGALARGVPTAHSAPPLSTVLDADHPLVWADEAGLATGTSVTPLHPAAPSAAREHPELHELLALVDSLRLGRARERTLAAAALHERLAHRS